MMVHLSLSELLLGAVLAVAFWDSYHVCAESLNSCPEIEDCITFVEGPCDANNRRTACIEWTHTSRRNACTLDPENNLIDHICVAGEAGSIRRGVSTSSPVCKWGIPAGESVIFGIKDGDRLRGGPQSRVLNLPRTSKRPFCSGYSSVCGTTGRSDISLNFTTSECRGCSISNLPESRLSKNGCTCEFSRAIGECSVNCGKGKQMAEYICTGTCVHPRQILSVPCRCESCAGLFDGDWTEWGPFDECAINCETKTVERQRERSCLGTRSAAGGRSCPGPSKETETCSTLVFVGECKTRTTPPPRVQHSAPVNRPSLNVQQSQPANNVNQVFNNPNFEANIPRTGVLARAPLDTCSKVSKCLKYYEGESCTNGNKHVCIYWDSRPECGLPLTYRVNKICKQNNFNSVQNDVEADVTFCQTVTANTAAVFGLDDGNLHFTGTEPGTYTIPTSRPGEVTNLECSGFTSVCSARDNSDLRLKFDVGSCPT